MKIELSSPAKITPYEHVFDLLGGSNSTLIVWEQTDRHACLIQNYPVYCDEIVQRWEEVTDRRLITGSAVGLI